MSQAMQTAGKIKQLLLGKNALLALGLAGILLLGVSEILPTKQAEPATENTCVPDVQQTERLLEQRVQRMVAGVQGVGRVEVMITCKNAGETIYALNESSQTQQAADDAQAHSRAYQSEHVFFGAGQRGQPLIEEQLVPQVQGAAIICEGAQSPAVALRVTELVATVLNVPTSRVCVVPMKNSQS